MTPETVVRLLAEPDRMRALGAVALGARTPDEVAAATGLSPRVVAAALHRLGEQGLMTAGGGDDLRVDYDTLREAARALPAAAEPSTVEPGLRPFLRGDRLVSVPAQQSRRRAVLTYVADRAFEPGVDYPERAVNDRLRAWCDGGEVDHVTIRRYLVDLRILSRADGVYRLGPEPAGAPDAAQRHVRAMGLG
ncbi:DUF2087 domain-containing protein [Micromonospora sp. WMMD882]|uniref:DUF2087 domain-containing protein n=1 Tax=Micromonospora sp. WMMD882 TaxID=3015151 RepID=UPI00248D1E27|nr:DUF2087 domain-containing protein [Micromonospora sp. WMMD882]WBB81660.1 DUF2087 domain-containing protein [Micromonospora sp. WMMD882]